MTPLAPHLEAFLRHRLPVERAASAHTVASYSRAWLLLVQFASARCQCRPSELCLESIDADLVLAFLEALESKRRNSVRTRNVRLAAIRSFFRFVEHRVPSALDQVRRIVAIPVKKADVPLVGHLSTQEAQAIVDAPDPSTRDGVRDRAMLHLAVATGLRVGELLALTLDDVALEPAQAATVLVHGKGRKERSLPLWKETVKALRTWLVLRPPSKSRRFFLNARGLPLSRDGFAWLLRKHAATAARRVATLRGKRVFPHILRHTCAMNVLQGTGDVRKVAIWLGHAHLQTTEIYTRADPAEKLEILAKTRPPSLRPGRFPVPDSLLALLTANRADHDYPE